jgi:hypothetical protein
VFQIVQKGIWITMAPSAANGPFSYSLESQGKSGLGGSRALPSCGNAFPVKDQMTVTRTPWVFDLMKLNLD